MGSVSEMVTVVPLHQRPDLLEACADLINEEWKRSRASRIHSLQRSSNNFPTCLVLIRTQRPVEDTTEGQLTKSQSQLLGHARLSRVIGHPSSLFVETVVVAKALRGKGYGRKLMEAVESYAKSRGFCHLHLTTHDKQHFYAHLGYGLSKPVQCAGFVSSLVPVEFLESFSQRDEKLPAGSGSCNTSASYSSRSGFSYPALGHAASPSPLSVCSGASPAPPPPPLLPPPPPPPPLHNFSFQPVRDPFQSSSLVPVPLSADNVSATTVPLPTPLPPPAPLPPPMASLPGQPNSCEWDKAQGQIFLETPYRDLKGRPIFWMEKSI